MKRLGWLGVGFALVVAPSVAMAGSQGGNHVYVSSTFRYALGQMGAVYGSEDRVQKIHCNQRVASDGQVRFVSCLARNTAGEQKSCFALGEQAEHLSEILYSVTSLSYIRFSWDSAGHCTSLEVRNSSIDTPK